MRVLRPSTGTQALAGPMQTEEKGGQWAGWLAMSPGILGKEERIPQCPTCSGIYGLHIKASAGVSTSNREPRTWRTDSSDDLFQLPAPSGLTTYTSVLWNMNLSFLISTLLLFLAPQDPTDLPKGPHTSSIPTSSFAKNALPSWKTSPVLY